ncbi:ribonuclease J [Sulfurimonas sp. SAG-AH-194-I05]|nr:ribonuclease J [Sulfurimonas sp. SAG-AH-194-I05]MDF1875280.1 ribonuclease J [Sulfurimonas sp. SAG-AH-194-I05]
MAEENQVAEQSKPQNTHQRKEVDGNREPEIKNVDGNREPQQKNVNGNRKPQHNNANRKPQHAKQNGDKPQGNKPNNNNKNKNRNRHRRQPTPVDENLKAFVVKNQEAHKQRLNPHYKLDLNSTGKLRITPLGGLGEIGGNIMVFETEKEAILVDVGMSFPDENMHGVDILVPDFAYLREIKDKIVGIVITHAHEDHIGAMPYLYKEMQFPIYGTSLPLAMIGTKFDEHHIKEHRKYFNPIEKRKIIKIGNDFEVEWMHMTHSIIDSSSVAITTEAGTVIHTGDFKIDYTPVDGYTADLHRLAYYGDKGVLCLLSDSTNSYNTVATGSELSVAPALDRVFSKAEGRVIMSTFSSNIHRVQQAIQYGIKYGRKICVIGRSMERNIEIAMQYDYVRFPKNIFIDADEVARLSDKEVLIVTTGSQGENNSALFRMSIGEHRHIKIKPTDLIVLSSRAIPGNEGSISQMLNHLQRAGAKVSHDKGLHVSGHASMEEQKLMLRLVNPKFFLPIHGEYNHVMKHRETGIMCGVPERNILLMTDGEQIEVAPKYMRKVKTVKTGKTYIDNQNNHKIDDDIVLDRQKLATDGIVMMVVQVDGKHTKMLAKPKITTFGIVADKQDKAFAKEMEDIVEHFLLHIKDGMLENTRGLENDLRQIVRKHIYRKMKRYPLIVPHVLVS